MTLNTTSPLLQPHAIPVSRVSDIRFPMLAKMPERAFGPDPSIVRLNLNESPYGPSPKALAAAGEALACPHRYPDHHCTELAAELSLRTGVPIDAITFGNGSGELLVQSALIALEAGDDAVMPSPTFPTCGKGVQMAGARVIDIALRADGSNDVPAMLAAITPRTRLFYLCTPNNPTGGLLSADDLALAIEAVPETCLLVVDEAYYEFAAFEGGPEVLPMLKKRKGPWVVTRTFSKAYCLAGLRVGYALTSGPDLNLGYTRIRHNFNVTRVSLAAALAALRDEAYATDVVRRTVQERQRLRNALEGLNATFLPSAANFLTVRLRTPAATAVESLRAAGIAVQFLSWPDSNGAMRISIGTSAESDRVVAVLAERRDGR